MTNRGLARVPCRDQKTPSKQTAPLSRRGLIGGAAAGLCALSAFGRSAQAVQSNAANGPARLIVAGVPESLSGQWASLLAPNLAETLHKPAFTLTTTTGWDGITGANLFETQQEQVEPPAALMVPGSAILAAMTGDSRVHYDYQRWVPTFLSHQPTVALGRASLHRSLASMINGRPLRVGVSSYNGAELPTVFALDLLALHPLPIPGLGQPNAAIDALRAGTVDVIQLPFDADYTERAATLQEEGFEPLFSNAFPKDPFLRRGLPPDFTTIYQQERRRMPNALNYTVWGAISAACNMKAGLMLPILSTPADISQWRHACQLAATQPDLRTHARDENEYMLTSTACTTAYAAMMPDVSSIMALRRWLALNIPKWRDRPQPRL
ncbi:MAG: hypothetical protein ABF839_03135 [Acetobacter orientalis]|uniref:hypothetical protein n=1 Tax=Acetobacter orientalis TaxID=146474 RepID=UPI00264AD6EB|nr:hypothetical protein [Acetobacter sp.]